MTDRVNEIAVARAGVTHSNAAAHLCALISVLCPSAPASLSAHSLFAMEILFRISAQDEDRNVQSGHFLQHSRGNRLYVLSVSVCLLAPQCEWQCAQKVKQ